MDQAAIPDNTISVLQGGTYQNPVVNANHPDPGALVLENGAGYAVVSTSNYANAGDSLFPILWSSDLVHWSQVQTEVMSLIWQPIGNVFVERVRVFK